MSLNKLNLQKADLRKQERSALNAIVELEFKVRMAERFINMVSYNSKKRSDREDQLGELQTSLKEQRIALELVEDMRKELGIVEEDEKPSEEAALGISSEDMDAESDEDIIS